MITVTFTKSYINIGFCLILLYIILGIHTAIFINDVSKDFIWKAKILIYTTPLMLIYFLYEIRKVYNYPTNLTIDFENQIITLDSHQKYKFDAISQLIITEQKFDYELYLKSIAGEIILQAKGYYETETDSNNISKYCKDITNFELIRDKH